MDKQEAHEILSAHKVVMSPEDPRPAEVIAETILASGSSALAQSVELGLYVDQSPRPAATQNPNVPNTVY